MWNYLTILKISTTTFPLTSSDLHLFPYVQDLRNHLNDAIKKFFADVSLKDSSNPFT